MTVIVILVIIKVVYSNNYWVVYINRVRKPINSYHEQRQAQTHTQGLGKET